MTTETKHNLVCQCGEVYGAPCEWSGDVADTVLVEVMPEHLRASHEAAGNKGDYPQNGAIRLRVERSCADSLVESEDGWAHIADPRNLHHL